MRNHHHHQQTATERAIDTAGNRCQSLCGTHPASATTSVSSSAPGATLTSMSTAATAGGTVKSPIMLDDDLSSLQASHAKLPQKQQQKHQHPNKLAAMSSATNNNNNNNHSEKVKITSNSITKYTTVTLPSLLANNHRENSAATMLHVNRKQFTPTSDGSNASFSSASVAGSIQDDMSDQCSLTQAGLEEYNIRASSYYDQPVLFHHQKQSSYAQSEGYHSYVSSSDSSSATPFLDRLRQESDLLSRQSSHNWSQNDLSSLSCASIAPSPLPMTTLMQESGVAVTGVVGDVVNNNINNNNSSNNNNNSIKLNDSCSNGSTSNGATTINIVTVNNNISGSCSTNNNTNNGSSSTNSTNSNSNHHHNHNSSESTSSTETLKWLGSTSDISEASHATGYSAISESVSSSQLIVHSSRVLTPKRHHSESVLYLNDDRPCSPPLNGNVVVVGGVHHATTPQEAPPSGPLARGAPNHRYSPSYPPVHTIPNHNMHQSYHQHKTTFGGSMKTDTGGSLTTLKHVPMELGSPLNGSDEEACPATQANHKSSISVTLQPGGGILPGACQAADEDMASKDSVASTEGANKPLTVNTASSADLESPASSCNTSPSGGAKNVAATSYRSNHRLFPVSTYTEPVHSNTSHYVHHPKPQYSTGLQKPAAASVQHATAASPATTSPPQTVKPQVPQAPQASWQSVAALINDFERTTDAQPQPQQQQPMPPMQQQPQQPQQKYAYIEPTKTHRVSNPALKAIQKNAVQSYFERQQAQQQQHQQHSKDSNQLQQQQQAKLYHPQPTSLPHANAQLIRPHSYQPMPSARDVATQQALRNSLPSPPAKASPSPPQKPEKPLTPLDVYVMGGGTPKPPSPGPPPPPPRSRSLMPTVTLLRRSSSASDYGEFRDQYMRATQEKLQAQSVKNISSAEKMSFNDCGMPPPPPPPRGRPSLTTRRTSSASEYAVMRDKALLQQAAALAHQQHHPQQHNGAMRQQPPSPQQQQQQQHYYYAPPAPAMMPHEGWVPERPPKNPNMRIPSPEPPPPPPAECDASLSDEPLPPPPPEILNRPHVAPPGYNESGLPSPSSVGASDLVANRRNSFAGSSTRKALFMRATSTGNEGMVPTVMKPPPPAVPKKPNNTELLQLARPSSSLAQQQSNKAHKVVLNGGAASGANSSGGLNRKRPHANPALMSMPPPILEHHTASTTTLAACKQSPPLPPPSSSSSSATAPPPLMPRMTSITQLQGPPPPTLSHHASKQR